MAKGFDGSTAAYQTVTPPYGIGAIWGSVWFYVTSAPAVFGVFLSRQGTGPGTNSRLMRVGVTPSGAVRFYAESFVSGVFDFTFADTSATVSLNTWNHAFWYMGSFTAVYLNGGNRGYNASPPNTAGAAGRTGIGANILSATPTFNFHYTGYLSDLFEAVDPGIWAEADVDNLAAAAYASKSPADLIYTPLNGQFRYWPFLRSLRSIGADARDMNTSGGTPSDEQRPNLGGRPNVQQPIGTRYVNIGGGIRYEPNLIVAG